MGKNWAIVIGINQYDNVAPLKYAERDAAAIANWFQQELQCEQVYQFVVGASPIPASKGDFVEAKPTEKNLKRFFRVRFEKSFLNPGDNLWFFFAGHGLRQNNRDYLLASDSDPGDPSDPGLSLNWITEQLRRCGADNVLLFVDACRDRGSRSTGGFGYEAQKGVVTFWACQPDHLSWELDEFQHGAFTYALLEGLQIQGEGNCATVERLDEHLRDRIPRLTQHRKPVQHPYTSTEPISKAQLILLPRQASPTDTLSLKTQALRAERNGDYRDARALWIRVLAVGPDPEAISEIEHLAILQDKNSQDDFIQKPLFQNSVLENSNESKRSATPSRPNIVDTALPKSAPKIRTDLSSIAGIASIGSVIIFMIFAKLGLVPSIFLEKSNLHLQQTETQKEIRP